MIKSELISELAEKQNQLPKQDIEMAVNCILDQMSKALAVGDHIEVRGFGSFSLNYQEARMGRNPKTGEHVQVKAKHKVAFKPGKELRERVNKSKPT